jgi:sporulation protein YlmC with PRC-barrel domain
MSKTITTAAAAVFAAMLASASPAAFAQTNPTTAPTATTATGTPMHEAAVSATRIEPGQIRAGDLKGADVYDAQDQKIATIADLVLDHSDGRVAAVVLDVDGRNVAVGMQNLHIAMDNNDNITKVTIDKSKADLQSAAAFHLNTTTGSGSSPPPADNNR